MKYTVAWARVASENSVLKFVILCLSALCLFFGASSLKLALKDPIVVDRGCLSKIASTSDGKRTVSEIEAFLKEALAQRFDTGTNLRADFLSEGERQTKEKEQKDLQGRKLSQRVLLNSINASGETVNVDADRLISIGEIRSAFRFQLIVRIESISRTETNPYGLLISEVKLREKEGK